MAIVEKAWKGITGQTAAEQAKEDAERARIKAQTDAAKARTFADTEGQGRGDVAEIFLGTEDEEIEEESNLRL